MEISGLGFWSSIWLIIRHPPLLPRGIEWMRASAQEFFIPQFATCLLPRRRRIAVVGHRLDGAIPFVPHPIRRYLGYVAFCLKTFLYLYSSFGSKAVPQIAAMMDGIVSLHRASGRIYRRCQSTTAFKRHLAPDPNFLLIRLVDPHLHCIPSLHILTVCFLYHRIRKAVSKLDSTEDRSKEATAQTYVQALRITEAALMVKQHSLADIGPTLFLLSRMFPDYDSGEIERFVSDLFAGSPYIEPKQRILIREAVLLDYRQMLTAERLLPATDPTELILRFLNGSLPGAGKKLHSPLV
jgi:hypothetical protein